MRMRITPCVIEAEGTSQRACRAFSTTDSSGRIVCDVPVVDMSSAPSISLSSMQNKPAEEKWLFTEEQLQNTPSRRENVAPAKELNYRQQAANLIQDMGQRLPVNQLTINTAIVYMHRFYMFHSFPAFSRFSIAPTALFLAAKVEEQPRKLEHVIKICHSCLKPNEEALDIHSDDYLKQAQQLVEHELIMLQTLGFDISIDHPHTHVVKCTQLVKASKDLSQMAYFMATNSLHLTTFCLKYKPTVVSAMCIHLSCKWSNYEIPLSSEGKAYWTYMDDAITEAMLENIISEFLKILDLCPTRLRKLKNYRPSTRDGSGKPTSHSKDSHPNASSSKVTSGNTASNRPADGRRAQEAPSMIEQKKPSTSLTYAEYKNKKEKELRQQQMAGKPLNRPETFKAGPSVPKGMHLQETSKAGQSVTKGMHLQETSKAGESVTKGMHPNHASTPSKPSTTSSSHGKPVGHPLKHADKVHPIPDNVKRIDKSCLDNRMAHASGIPGLQRPKNPSVPSPSHHIINQRDKDHSRQQLKHVPHHDGKTIVKPHDKLTVPRLKEDHTMNRSRVNTAHQVKSAEPGDILAGMEQKVIEQMHATKAKEVPKLNQAMPFGKTELQNSQPNVNNYRPKQSRGNLLVQKDSTGKVPAFLELPKTYQGLYEMYKKNPDVLGYQLKQKVQATSLSEEEKLIWHKLQKSEDRRRKKKLEKQRTSKSHHSLHDAERAGTSSGSLTVRIKLPSLARTEALKSGTSSDGSQLTSTTSGSDTGKIPSPGSTMKAGRKRNAHDMPVAAPAKHLKKAEGHHHQSHDQTKHRHKHSRSGSHHQSKHNSGNKIDEATFRQALNDAVTMVQSGHTMLVADPDRGIPTVTLKRAETRNGGKEGYMAAHSSKQEEARPPGHGKQLGFDPSAPVSATPPENLFDAETAGQSRSNHISKDRHSSPEMGEIIDDDDDDSSHRPETTDYHSNAYRQISFNKPSVSSNDRVKNYNRPDSHKVGDKSLPNLVPTNLKRGDQRI